MSLADVPEISNWRYEDLEVGERFGPFTERLDPELSAQLRGEVGRSEPGGRAPYGVLPLITLRSLRRALEGIIPGGVLMGQHFAIHAPIPADASLEVGVAVSRMLRRGERLFTTFTFDLRCEDRLAAVVDWTILAPPAS
jgi:hypothetical protein